MHGTNRLIFGLALAVVASLGSSTAWAELGIANGQFRVERLDDGVYFGPAPKSDQDFKQLRRLGIRHVIDTRTFKVIASGMERRRAQRHGLLYERIPIGFFPTRTQTLPSIMRRLEKQTCGPIFVHCNLGSDRTGLIAALYRVNVLGWDADTAFATWKADQFNVKLNDLDRYYWQHVPR